MFQIEDDICRVPEILFDGKIHVWRIEKPNRLVKISTVDCKRGYGFIVQNEKRPTDAIPLAGISLVLTEEDGKFGKWLTVRYNKHATTYDVHAAMAKYGFGQYEAVDVGYLYYKRNVNA